MHTMGLYFVYISYSSKCITRVLFGLYFMPLPEMSEVTFESSSIWTSIVYPQSSYTPFRVLPYIVGITRGYLHSHWLLGTPTCGYSNCHWLLACWDIAILIVIFGSWHANMRLSLCSLALSILTRGHLHAHWLLPCCRVAIPYDMISYLHHIHYPTI